MHQWVPLDVCIPILDKQKYATFLPGSADAADPEDAMGKRASKAIDSTIGNMMIFNQGEVQHAKVGCDRDPLLVQPVLTRCRLSRRT